MEFTKGDWKVVQSLHGRVSTATCVIAVESPDYVPSLVCDTFKINIPEAEANAHLISAAPRLYEALNAIKEWSINFCPLPDSLIIPVLQALEKAEGKAPSMQ